MNVELRELIKEEDRIIEKLEVVQEELQNKPDYTPEDLVQLTKLKTQLAKLQREILSHPNFHLIPTKYPH